ncbi:hypothetical protein ACPEMX_14845 [Klebsiella quasipneumoniae]|uniref:hypothetical protein n=1 Tax=Enterobacteriaceae TaxID=543 RepID=UPI001E4B5084|nr:MULTISPECIES: hypothetical protein [Enterobacteriaceae]MCO6021864.1 hypothetical protein [Enterobacter hormaechei]MCR4211262.1 hypothetical protein [Enterobacter hormaechei]
MSTELNQPAITARIIPNNRRMAFLPRLFGAWYLTGEAGVYNHARSLCADYGVLSGNPRKFRHSV